MKQNTETLKQCIRSVLELFPPVQAAYLFGSHAENNAGPGSDVDIALIGPRNELAPLKLDILAGFTAAGLDRVDLVLLDGADPVLRFEAVHYNCLAYAREDFDHPGFFTRGLREYFDLEPYLAIQREAIKHRLQHGQT